MAVDDGERLVVMLEARIRDFEKNMQKAERTGSGSFRRLQTDSRTATSRMQRDMTRSTTRMNQALATTTARIGTLGKMSGFSAFGAGALAALGPVLSISAALAKASAAVSDFDRIAKDAKATGLDSDFYQELAYGADLAGVGVGELNASMIAFVRNSGLAAVGQGELAGKLKDLNPELLKALQTAITQEERFRLVADAVKAATSETEKAAIASAAFGRNGAKMVELLKNGADGFDDLAIEARRLGLVIDRQLLAKAEELNDEMSTARRIMDAEFKKALINLAPFLVSTARLAGNVAFAIRSIADAMKGLETKSKAGLLETLAEKEASLKKAETSSVAGFILRGADGEGLERLKGEIAAIKAELKARAIDELRTGLNSQTAELQRKPGDPEDPNDGTGRNRAAAAALRDAEAYKRLAEQIRESTAATRADTEVQSTLNPVVDDFGQALATARAERDLLTAAQKAGKEITPELEAEIRALADGYGEAEAAAARLREEQERSRESVAFQKDLLKGALSDMRSALRDGKLEWEEVGDIAIGVLDKIIDKIEDQLIDAIFDLGNAGKGSGGGGGILGFLGGLFNLGGGGGGQLAIAAGGGVGLYDTGGWTGGQRGKAAGIVHGEEFVVKAGPAARHRGMLEAINAGGDMPGGAGGGQVQAAVPAASGDIIVTITNNVDATGADSGELRRTQQVLATMQRDLPGHIVTTVKDAQKRRVLR